MTTYYHYTPADKAHVVLDDDPDGTTLCGLSHDGDVEPAGDNPDAVLPAYKGHCYRCRAAYFQRVRDELDVDTSDLEEGTVVEFWVRDVTDPSESLARREDGVIVEVPPWWPSWRDEDEGDDPITTSYRVRSGGVTYESVSFDRIWRVDHADPEDVLDTEVAAALMDALGGD